MVEMRQGPKTMSGPTKDTEALVLGGKLRHDGHPILRWNAANVAVLVDSNENLKPDKNKSAERIDGIVAMIMAIGRALIATPPMGSVYEERGLLQL